MEIPRRTLNSSPCPPTLIGEEDADSGCCSVALWGSLPRIDYFDAFQFSGSIPHQSLPKAPPQAKRFNTPSGGPAPETIDRHSVCLLH